MSDYWTEKDVIENAILDLQHERDDLKAEIARLNGIIARLKEDGDSLASVVTGGVTQDAEEYWECPYCMAMAYNAGDIQHAVDCPIHLHRALMKELE